MNVNIKDFIDNDGHVVMTFINEGYFDYLHNLIMNLEMINVPWKLCVICIDKNAKILCDRHNIPSLLYDLNTSKTFSYFGSLNFRLISFSKFNTIKYVLNNDHVKSVTYMDSDIHVYKDFVPHLKELRKSKKRYDIYIQSDSNVKDINHFNKNRCTGFMHIIKGNKMINKLCDYTPEHVKMYSNDQHYFNRIIDDMYIKYIELPRNLFPNGVFFNNVPEDAFIIHYNYMVGTDKEKNMQSKNHWYVNKLN